MITMRYFAPAAPLRDYISSYYWFETDNGMTDLIRAELAQVRFRVSGQSTLRFGSGSPVGCPAALLSGPTLRPSELTTTGHLRAFGAGLLPAGWAALIGACAGRHADGLVDLAALEPVATADCLSQLAAATNDAMRVQAADRFFMALAARAHAAPIWFTRLTDAWLIGSVNPRVDALIGAAGVSARQVERLTLRTYGATPKLMARKYRALQAAVRLGTTGASTWADGALDAFYDQSHFIREFKTFIGTTPCRFARAAAPLSRLTMARRAVPGLPRLAFYS